MSPIPFPVNFIAGVGDFPLLEDTYLDRSSTVIQALVGVPITGDANLWQNLDPPESDSDYVSTSSNTTNARGGGFFLPQLPSEIEDRVTAGETVLKMEVRFRTNNGTPTLNLQLMRDGDGEGASNFYNYNMNPDASATFKTSVYTIDTSRIPRLNFWSTSGGKPGQYVEFWKPVTGGNRGMRIAWFKIWEEEV